MKALAANNYCGKFSKYNWFTMEVLLLTVLGSVWLAMIFVLLFWWDRKNRPLSSLERDSLMPLNEEVAVTVQRQDTGV
ncbi:MAG: hypothetical protein SFY80_15270 [Verrucomicrobiota bacterium]|nr:hypothetical protein [Verrucomicrobiota bacterium]